MGNTLEAVLLAGALRRVGFRAELDRPVDPLWLVSISGGLATTLGASIGVFCLWSGGLLSEGQWGSAWRAWWLGDLIGVLGAFLLAWGAWRGAGLSALRWAELGAVVVTLVVLGLAAFGLVSSAHIFTPQHYWVFPVLIWAALRFGVRGATLSNVVVGVIAVLGALQAPAPFADQSAGERLFWTQVFVAVFALTGLVLGAAVEAEGRSRRSLQATRAELDARVKSATTQLNEAQRLAQIGSWTWDVASNQVAWSSQLYRNYGLEPDQFAATYEGFLEFVHPDDRAHVKATIGRALEVRQPFDFEHRIVRPTGEIRVLHAKGQVVSDEEGRPVRLVGTGQDITERKRADETRQRLEREQTARASAEDAIQARDDFLSVASHELKTPLTALKLQVQGLLKAAQARQGVPVELVMRLQGLGRQADRLGLLITNLLDLSRITAGRLDLELEEVDLVAVVREAVARAQEELRKTGCALSIDAPEALIGRWDRARLDQVVTNLVLNAAKYGTGRPIEVTVAQGGGAPEPFASFTVRDHGIGIALEDQVRIFERFERAVPSRHFGGIGLGLWIVRRAVESMGGEVSVRSELGNGAEFHVRLPLQPPRMPEAEADAAVQGAP